MQLGIFTSGGDQPGTNKTIAEICSQAGEFGWPRVIGIHNGTWGLFPAEYYPESSIIDQRLYVTDKNGNSFPYDDLGAQFSASSITDWSDYKIDDHGKMIKNWPLESGTMLGSVKNVLESDDNKWRQVYANAKKSIDELGIEAIVFIGGNGSFNFVPDFFYKSGIKIPIIGIPGTIDGDVPGVSGISMGLRSAASHNGRLIAELHTTGDSMNGIHIIQIMGQNCGALTVHSAVESKIADIVLIPELGYNRENLTTAIKTLRESGQNHIIIVIAEGIYDLDGKSFSTHRYGNTIMAGEPHKYIRTLVEDIQKSEELKNFVPLPVRSMSAGHTQRAPQNVHSHDLELAGSMAHFAVRQLLENFSQLEEPMMVSHGHSTKDGFKLISLREVNQMPKTVSRLSPETTEILRKSGGHFVYGNESRPKLAEILRHHIRQHAAHHEKGWLSPISPKPLHFKTVSVGEGSFAL